jgi:hypothetical protein
MQKSSGRERERELVLMGVTQKTEVLLSVMLQALTVTNFVVKLEQVQGKCTLHIYESFMSCWKQKWVWQARWVLICAHHVAKKHCKHQVMMSQLICKFLY